MVRIATILVMAAIVSHWRDCSAQTTPIPTVSGDWQTVVRNGTYEGITLRNGSYRDSSRTLTIESLSAADLDGDGVEDAAVVFVSWGGGTGFFYSLAAVRNDHARPVKVAEVSLGDRITLKDLFVRSGQITVDYVTQGPNDAMCCPTRLVRSTFAIRGGVLEITGGPQAEALPASPTPTRSPTPLTGTLRGGNLTLQTSPTLPKFEPLRAWVVGTPGIRQHLEWLDRNVLLPSQVAVSFEACGVANAFYNPATRQITMCYEYLDKRISLVRANLRPPTDEKVNDAVLRTTLHVINHELGHALVHQLGLPVLGREEDAADGFSAFILLERGDPQDAYSVLQGALSNSQRGMFENGSEADVHSLNDQRFYSLLCWMLGSDPTRFAGFAQVGNLPAFRQKGCPHEWAQLQASWKAVLGDHLRPAAGAVALLGTTSGPMEFLIADNQTLRMNAGQEWVYRFRLNTKDCRIQMNTLGLDGGKRDIVTMVFDSYNYMSRSSGAYAEPVFQSGRLRQLATEVPVKGPGDFVLVISNKFSILTGKVAKVSARAICTAG